MNWRYLLSLLAVMVLLTVSLYTPAQAIATITVVPCPGEEELPKHAAVERTVFCFWAMVDGVSKLVSMNFGSLGDGLFSVPTRYCYIDEKTGKKKCKCGTAAVRLDFSALNP